MASDWRFTVTTLSVSGASDPSGATGTRISGVRMLVTVWTGGGSTDQRPEVVVDGSADVTVPAAALSVTVDLRHDRYAPLTMALVRGATENVWRWTDPNRVVVTAGLDVSVLATMSRVRFAPQEVRDEDQMRRAAEAAMKPVDDANALLKTPEQKKHRKQFAIADANLRAALVTKDRAFFRQQSASLAALGNNGRIDAFHVARRELLGSDAGAAGWLRLASTSVRVDPYHEGDFYIVEYGEVGDAPATGPRFAVGLFVPLALSQPETRQVDMVVWYHPNTTNPVVWPPVDYPYGPPYPYGLMAVRNAAKAVVPAQRFLDIPSFHIHSQHFLAYQMLAAKKQAVIVVPVAPSSHFEVFEHPGTLMRMLREIAAWLPVHLPRGSEARVHPGPKIVGRVGVAAFSASVPRLTTLMTARTPDAHYATPVWGASEDVTAFGRVWREQWAIDGVHGGFTTFLNQAAGWARGDDRRLRIYKTPYTNLDQIWHPMTATGPGTAWASLVSGGRVETRTSGSDLFGQWCSGDGDRWQAVSFSSDFVLGPVTDPVRPAPALQPSLNLFSTTTAAQHPAVAHDIMPRICFGHAMVTSGLKPA